MNYTLVKQFSNNAVDNVYIFFYKTVDFFKILFQTLIAFYEIWEAFFLIFYNIYKYFQYLLIFAVDKSTESESTFYFWKRIPVKVSYKPSSVLARDSFNPVPAMYGKHAAAKFSGSGTAAKTAVISAARKLQVAPSGAKIDITRRVLEFFENIFKSIMNILFKPVDTISDFISRRMKPVKEEPPKSGSLIDEYMKEYERKKRA
jgi:hypothetical protein